MAFNTEPIRSANDDLDKNQAGLESLAENQLTRAQLEAHAEEVDVSNSNLLQALEEARTEVETLVANPDLQAPVMREALKDSLMSSLAEATGEETPGEETVWLAEKLEIDGLLGEALSPAAESMDQGNGVEFMLANRELFERFLGGDELEAVYARFSSEVPEEYRTAALFAESARELVPFFEGLEGLEGIDALLDSPDYQAKNIEDRVEALKLFLAENGERVPTPETDPAAVVGPNTNPDTQGLDARLRALIEAVPEGEIGTPEYTQWIEAIKGGNEQRGYVQYVNEEIIPTKEGLEQFMLHFRINIMPQIEDFMEMFEGFTGDGQTAAERQAETEARTAEIDAATAEAMGLNPAALQMANDFSAEGYRIADVNVDSLSATAEVHGEAGLNTINNIVANLAANSQWGQEVLQANLYLAELQHLADSDFTGEVRVTGTGDDMKIIIEGTEVAFNDPDRNNAIATAVQAYIDGGEARAAAAAEAEANETRTAAIKTLTDTGVVDEAGAEAILAANSADGALGQFVAEGDTLQYVIEGTETPITLENGAGLEALNKFLENPDRAQAFMPLVTSEHLSASLQAKLIQVLSSLEAGDDAWRYDADLEQFVWPGNEGVSIDAMDDEAKRSLKTALDGILTEETPTS